MTWEPDYITSADLKDEQDITDNKDDAQIARWITSASRTVDGWCHRQFGQVAVAEERTYVAEYDRHECAYFVFVDDIGDITGLAIETEDGTAVTDYTLLPRNALAEGGVYEQIKLSVGGVIAVTARWGWPTVPTAVKGATMLQTQRLAARRGAPFGIAGSPSEGSEMRLLAKLDPDAQSMLGKKYRRERWAA